MAVLLGSETQIVLRHVEGDELPTYNFQVLEKDITGYTIVMALEHPERTRVTQSGTVTNGPTGEFQIPSGTGWPDGILVNGLLRAHIELTDPAGNKLSFPNLTFSVIRSV